MTAPPLCRYCGKAIAKETRKVSLHDQPLDANELNWNSSHNFSRHLSVAAYPKTKAECQALTNQTVVSISRGVFVKKQKSRETVHGNVAYYFSHDFDKNYIGAFTEWDGESYADKFFCSGDHAKAFGYVCAREGRCTADYNIALKKQRENAA